jgi:hypothetical protein
MRGSLLLMLGCWGCTVPAYPDPVGGDTDTAVVTEETDLPPEEESDVDTDPGGDGDTGWIDDSDLDTDVFGGGTGTPIGCHPYDPVEASAGWERRYQVTYGRDAGNERHEGAGLETLPAWMAGTYTEAYGYEVAITNAGDANSTGHYYVKCDVDGPGAFDIGWVKSFQGGLLGRTTISLRAKARQARKYLASEAELLGSPYWDEDFRYELTQVGGTLGGSSTGELKHEGAYVTFGFETVTVPMGTFQSALHVNTLYTETKLSSGGGLLDAFFSIFDQMFGALFGFDEGGASVTAQADRWYVRGIGLVKEETIDFTDGSLIVRKELRECSGLPDCP